LPFARHRDPAAPLSRAHAFTESEVWLPKKVFATDRLWRKAAARLPKKNLTWVKVPARIYRCSCELNGASAISERVIH
jgi:hypothetical protein